MQVHPNKITVLFKCNFIQVIQFKKENSDSVHTLIYLFVIVDD